MELPVFDSGKAKASGKLAVAADVFDKEYNEPLIHQIVTAYMAGARQGTQAQKTRAEVKCSGKKPWRQKGTGRARAGSAASPIWRGGGRAFAAKPRSYAQKVNKKMYRAAIRSILSELARQERLIVVENLAVAEPKTKLLRGVLQSMQLDDVLIVTDVLDENLYLSARNLKNIDVIDVEMIDPVSLVGFQKVMMTTAAIKQLEERFV